MNQFLGRPQRQNVANGDRYKLTHAVRVTLGPKGRNVLLTSLLAHPA